jgi:CIC family chloride channel protein
LLVVSISNGNTNAIHGKSIFQWQLEMRGLFFHDGPHHHMMKTRKVMDFMVLLKDGEEGELQENQIHLRPTDSLEFALRVFDSGADLILPVVDETDGKTLIGWAGQVEALSFCNAALVESIDEAHHH